MKSHFQGTRLREALKDQPITRDCPDMVVFLMAAHSKGDVQIEDFPAHEVIERENELGADLYLILHGEVEIWTKNQRKALRKEGEHIGEMAQIRGGRRTADMRTTKPTTVMRIPDAFFLVMENNYPAIWKSLARTLATRLDQRRDLDRQPNAVPYLFIASSGESIEVARALKTGLSGLNCIVRIWKDDPVFKPSGTIIGDLINETKLADFAVAIFGRDDKLNTRGVEMDAPRDNVVFEAGLFAGEIGLDRTYIMTPEGANYRVLSDLGGVNRLTYKSAAAMQDALESLRERLQTLGSR
jgi:CRP/FNR family transcriptional regulator, cyclic AMP receptor protein